MKNTDVLVIETHGLSKAYKKVHTLKSLDLKVAQHSIFGFLGPNGPGKTTTIKLLLGEYGAVTAAMGLLLVVIFWSLRTRLPEAIGTRTNEIASNTERSNQDE